MKQASSHRPVGAAIAAAGASSDEELAARVLWRDEPALGTIYDRYGRLIYAIALRITGDHEASEEVTQDVFQAFWQGAGSFRNDGSLPAWLAGIARHRAIDMTRSRGQRARAREESLDAQAIAGAAHDAAEMLALRLMVQSALKQLPAAQRQAIELAFYGDLTNVEIATRLGQPIGTIKSRLRLGMTRLRDLLSVAQE